MIKISETIEKTCRDLGINYQSPHHEKIQQRNIDAQRMADIYYKIKEVMSELIELTNKYPEIREVIDIDLKSLDHIDHDIINEARKIIRRKGVK